MRVLVTGGAGFIGSNLVNRLIKVSDVTSVDVIDNLYSGNVDLIENLDRVTFYRDNVINFDPRDEYDIIFHQAALSDPRCEDPSRQYKWNVEGFARVLKLGKKIIYASSASMYGNTPTLHKEGGIKDIKSTYALSKLVMDEMALQADVPCIGLRYFNVYGPGEQFKGRAASMIFHLWNQLKSGQRPRLFKCGEHRRDFVHVEDCVLANLAAMREDVPPGIYNVGCGIDWSFNQVLTLLRQMSTNQQEVEYIDCPYGDYQGFTCASIYKLKTVLKVTPRIPSTGIREYIRTLNDGK